MSFLLPSHVVDSVLSSSSALVGTLELIVSAVPFRFCRKKTAELDPPDSSLSLPLMLLGLAQLGLPSSSSSYSACCVLRLADLSSISTPSITQSRLDFAKTLVPSVRTVLIERGVEPLDVAKKIKEAAGAIELSLALEW